MIPPHFLTAIATKKTDPDAQALKAAKAVKSGDSTLRTSVTSHRSKTLRKERNPKRLRSSEELMNKVGHYEILKYPLTTEAAIKNMECNNTLVFIVDVKADKKMIRAAFENICGVKTKRVNTSIR